ncbi:MAG: Gfo/Idh/MocA family oxidoreductase [Bryobacteraceae bacterium]|nr:Gfo/Idh/MocA family oxidoreductase [Bryobacterales bacterium]NUN00397.1 Gfo/Idh/MocA family oxidoreductase [Bryobacteraceae bacterium]
MDRRYFLFGSFASAAAARAASFQSANDRVRIACVGFNNQGRAHIGAYTKMPDVELAALCDTDDAVLEKGCGMVEAAGRKRPAVYTDIRKLLEDKSIDAISIATPNHQHTLQAIWACQAGKDVYVEKPCAHNVFEARQIVAAARKYNRVMQHGTGASAVLHETREKLQEGIIGDLYMARALCFKMRNTIGRAPIEPVPAGVHYDLWLGPAPKHPFTKNRYHYNFHWFWDYGNGDIGNQGIHQLHAARWALGVKYPAKVSAVGGHFLFDDDQETPNTLAATFEYNDGGKKRMLVFEVRHWFTNSEAGLASKSDAFSGPAAGATQTVGNIFYGRDGYMVLGNGFKTFLGKEQVPGPVSTRTGGDPYRNFIDVMRSRKRSDLLAEIEEGAISTVSVHLANISYRLGRSLQFDANTMRCVGDEQANAMLTRAYRAPFVVPKIV